MNEIEVRIVELEPMRVASIWGFGQEPETIAFAKLEEWAGPRGIRENPGKHRIFGFNNPNPYPGTPNYGYEIWVEVGAEVEPVDDVRILDFDGGHYAVARCEIPEGEYDVIGATWKKLVAWREDSEYKCGHYQWLEQSIASDTPGIEFVLDLHLPIAK
jgi:AraC family transcriptional regulator